MKIKEFSIGSLGENIYVVFDEETKETFVVDPGKNIDVIIDFIKKNELKLKYILITHAHIDHIEGVEPLSRRLGGKILLHSEDIPALQDEKISLAYMLDGPFDKFKNYYPIEQEKDIKIGSIEVSVIHTPGHTKGSVSLLAGSALFTGDTLFKESIGRTDFPGGDFYTILKSIKEGIIPLGNNIKVYPGHGENTTIQHEVKYNTFITGEC